MPADNKAISAELKRLQAEMESRRANSPGDGFATAQSLANSTGMPVPKVRKLIRAGLEAGTIEAGKVAFRQISGSITPLPAYRSVTAAKKCR